MKKSVFLIALFISSVVTTSALAGNNDDPVLLRINERKITLSEFEYVYTKNNLNPQVMDPKSIEEYLELFINFNLKVYEALQLGLDTHQSFINELNGYREQLAQPYLRDQEVTSQLLDEALERSNYDIRASHILINLEQHAAPEDTLAAWNKLMEIRERILAGENFSDMATEYSQDPSAKGMDATPNRPAMPGNAGDLNYFTVLDMVYPFETAAYTMDIGDISMPVRTQFGYHLIKVTDRLPAMGRARVGHIMVMVQQDAPEEDHTQAEMKIREIYQKLQDGEEFASLAERFSDDKASGRRGGELPAFTANRMVPEFISAIAELNEQNDISEPVKTAYGWHIIKLFEKTRPSQDEIRADLQNRISRDQRAFLSQRVVIDRLKKEYNFKLYDENLDVFFAAVDNTIFERNWDKTSIGETDEPLFSFSGNVFSQQDFADHLAISQTMRSPELIRTYVVSMFENYVEQMILEYESEKLPEKYPEFRKIMNEYHDGILLFELTDQKVWGRAMQDTAGLNQFFKENIENYMWDDRLNVNIYTFNSREAANKGRRVIRRAVRRGVSHDEILAMFNAESPLEVSSETGTLEMEKETVLEKLPKRNGVTRVLEHNGNFIVANVREFIPAQPKKLSEIRGLVIADYQNYLENKWVDELRERYPYIVYREVLQSLKNR